jgi:nitric oxide synthase oxygenase domain/subunit
MNSCKSLIYSIQLQTKQGSALTKDIWHVSLELQQHPSYNKIGHKCFEHHTNLKQF